MNHDDNCQSKFHALLQEQIYYELTAAQQYTAVAVYLDRNDLPQLATFFYKHALEERSHGMMLVQYLIDRKIPVTIPGTDSVCNDFNDVQDAIKLVLNKEYEVTDQMTTLARVARDEGDYLGEQFMQWFLQEQVEEVSIITTLLRVAQRAESNLFDLEDFVAREVNVASGANVGYRPKVAGGVV